MEIAKRWKRALELDCKLGAAMKMPTEGQVEDAYVREWARARDRPRNVTKLLPRVDIVLNNLCVGLDELCNHGVSNVGAGQVQAVHRGRPSSKLECAGRKAAVVAKRNEQEAVSLAQGHLVDCLDKIARCSVCLGRSLECQIAKRGNMPSSAVVVRLQVLLTSALCSLSIALRLLLQQIREPRSWNWASVDISHKGEVSSVHPIAALKGMRTPALSGAGTVVLPSWSLGRSPPSRMACKQLVDTQLCSATCHARHLQPLSPRSNKPGRVGICAGRYSGIGMCCCRLRRGMVNVTIGEWTLRRCLYWSLGSPLFVVAW
eukprot:m.57196 g.57196  ORF g.57196 m.57196 type:complete len:317 (+) comp7065_c0_seq2:436-1386(+)